MTKRKLSPDPRSKSVARLHRAFRKGLLNVFVGAGVSQESGFAGWDAFNQELIHQYLVGDIGSTTPAAMLALQNIPSTAEELLYALGRDAAADFVHSATRRRFAFLLAGVLYKGRNINDLPLKSVHRQIAALAEKARLFTLNFDPLLEIGLSLRFPSKSWTTFRSPSPKGKALARKYKVEHLHGWIDPDGKQSPALILTESQYLELTEDSIASANMHLEKMLTGKDTTLVLGMSLTDPNFRRVLYFLNKRKLSSRERIYVVMRQQKPAIDHYAKVHWLNRGLKLLFVQNYDEIPGLLRDIQWGEAATGQIARWTSTAISWRQAKLPDAAIFSDAWQKAAYGSLEALVEQVKNLFGVPMHEKLVFSLFVPFWEAKDKARLRMIASSRMQVTGGGAFLRATKRVLEIRKGQEQGIAGVSFFTGTNRAVEYGEGKVDINFTPRMTEQWVSSQGYRDWRSIIAVPILDTPEWVPVAVLSMTSNLPVPFWKQFGTKQDKLEPELYTVMRRTAHFCLVDFA